MKRTMKTTAVIGVIVSLVWLSACAPSTPSTTPTLDLNPFRTEVAATVLAQVSQTLSAVPSATPVPSHTPTITLPSTPTQAVSTSPSPNPTTTPGTPETGARDQAQWVSQTIPDGTIFAPGEPFTITFRLKNVGTSTWTAAYLLRFYSGESFGAPKELPIGKVVLPGDTVDIPIPMKAPVKPADYRSDWVMANESRSNFKEPIYLKITVATPATPSPTTTTAP